MKHNKLWTRIVGVLLLTNLIAHPASAAVANPVLAQIPQNFRTGWQTVLGLLCMIGFVWGVILIWGGVEKARKAGDFGEGKLGILCGAVIAGSTGIMGALYFIFGIGEGVLQPLFN